MTRPFAVIALIALAACAGQTAPTTALLASPAAQNCTAHHGRIIVRQTGEGSKGFCALTDGRTMALWEYFHQTNP